eukprot:3676622-Amphidinium_carterae.1
MSWGKAQWGKTVQWIGVSVIALENGVRVGWFAEAVTVDSPGRGRALPRHHQRRLSHSKIGRSVGSACGNQTLDASVEVATIGGAVTVGLHDGACGIGQAENTVTQDQCHCAG